LTDRHPVTAIDGTRKPQQYQ